MRKFFNSRTASLIAVIMILVLAVSLTGCNSQNVPDESSADLNTDSATRIFVDLAGAEVELPKEINNVVHLWPASTALQVFLGSGEKITGTLAAVQKGWGWLTAASPNLMDVQGFTSTPTVEELVALDPDVVITPKKEDAEYFRANGIPAVCMLAKEDIDSLKEMIVKMGELLGEKEAARANEYIEYLDGNIAKVKDALKDIKDEDKPVIYYNSAQKGDSPLLTCGDDSIVATWMDICNVKNAVSGTITGMDKEVAMEVIAAANPDYILVGGTSQDKAWEAILADQAWQGLTAVQKGKMLKNPQGVMKWEKFGVEIALQILWFSKEIYPDKMQDVDLKAEVQDFYQKYYNFKLTDELYADLISGKGRP